MAEAAQHTVQGALYRSATDDRADGGDASTRSAQRRPHPVERQDGTDTHQWVARRDDDLLGATQCRSTPLGDTGLADTAVYNTTHPSGAAVANQVTLKWQ
jgi:hypothetical protein